MTSSFRDKLLEHALDAYGTRPEYPWARFPNYAVLRHADNRKWYGLVMDVPRNKLGLEGEVRVAILNVKISDEGLYHLLLQQEGYLPGYHISKGSWISILLDGTVAFDEVCEWLALSFDATASNKTKQETRAPKEWIVPANPKYFDIEHAFDTCDEITWKQGRGIRVEDTIFVYAAAPVSAIIYKCAVTETDIPYHYDDGKVTITALMRLSLQRRYDPSMFTLAVLRDEFDIASVRGPRGVPRSLSLALDKLL